jgi:two-component system, cell cycle response regulator
MPARGAAVAADGSQGYGLSDAKEDRLLNLRRKTVVTVISKIGDRRPRADACFVVIYGQSIGRRFRLKRGEVLIGRSSQAQIQIDHESVSRKHAQVTIGETKAIAKDLGSTNGTYVNDEPVSERVLNDGDLIKVGRTILKYLSNNNIESAYHEEIYRLTTIDGLTRCFNKRYLKEQLMRECSRATRYERPLSMVLFDVDNFRELNEEYGHLAGDAVLTQMGKRISRRIRREDIFARTEGGQFALVAPEIAKDEGVKLADRLMHMVGEGSFGFDDVQIPVAISVAVVSVSDIDEESIPDSPPTEDDTHNETAAHPFVVDISELGTFSSKTGGRFYRLSEAMFTLARQRLLDAKKNGKGQIVSA